PETTVLVPVGSKRVIEFVPDEPGDWAMHCHMTHHVMTQMGHDLPPMIGADMTRIDQRMARVLPGYMTMGTRGMGNMADMEMPIPGNSLPMRGGKGPFGTIDMGGMFTILKVRDDPDRADPAGWYSHPAGSVAGPADPERLRADGIVLDPPGPAGGPGSDGKAGEGKPGPDRSGPHEPDPGKPGAGKPAARSTSKTPV